MLKFAKRHLYSLVVVYLLVTLFFLTFGALRCVREAAAGQQYFDPVSRRLMSLPDDAQFRSVTVGGRVVPGMNPAHVFADNTARDAYFTSNPAERTPFTLISVGEGWQEWSGTAWVSKTQVLTGPRGLKGDTPVKGVDYDDGVTPVKGVDYDDGLTYHPYTAYASDAAGSDFSLTPGTLKYTAQIFSTTVLDPPTESDFSAATWVKFAGDDGYTPVKDTDYFDGAPGKSAYELAVDGGFEGTEEEWIASLKGLKGDSFRPDVVGLEEDRYLYDNEPPDFSYASYDIGMIFFRVGEPGMWSDGFPFRGESAYEVAVRNGFGGTEEDWLASLKAAGVVYETSCDDITSGLCVDADKKIYYFDGENVSEFKITLTAEDIPDLSDTYETKGTSEAAAEAAIEEHALDTELHNASCDPATARDCGFVAPMNSGAPLGPPPEGYSGIAWGSDGTRYRWNVSEGEWEEDTQPGDGLGDATAADVADLFEGEGDCLRADGTKGECGAGTGTGLPAGGTIGQVVIKGEETDTWADVDGAFVAHAPEEYTPQAPTVAGHLEGIEMRFAAMSDRITVAEGQLAFQSGKISAIEALLADLGEGVAPASGPSAWEFSYGDYVTLADNDALTLNYGSGVDWTITGWIYRPSNWTQSTPQYIMSWGAFEANPSFQLFIDDWLVINFAGATHEAADVTSLVGEWMFVVINYGATFDGRRVWINGTQVTNAGFFGPAINVAGALYFGGRSDLNAERYFEGRLSQWAKWNRSLTSDERADLLNCVKTPDQIPTGLAWYLPMDSFAEEVVGITVTNNGATQQSGVVLCEED